ncbi:hypothetical protein GBAR_LOCUS29367 [Geodia barretti]|uniref:Ig-like domain-containing protein n=1 Tax=Geodia barretti TaxID=519541 RepID=A0AA35TSN6_GEOBA|nr:hypothetical protein GBAR_LOCUS29367 [Geodia barretti]
MKLLVAFLFAGLANAQLDAQAPAILQGPVSHVVDVQRTVTFSCTAKAEDIKWIINGSRLESSAYDGAIDVRRIPSDVLFYSSVTFPVSQQYHSTRVRCQAVHQQSSVESPEAYLTITDTNGRDDERDDCSQGAGSDSWHILVLSAAMALYVALTTPLVIILAVMYIVRQRKETSSKVAQKRQVEDAKNQTKGREEEEGDYIHMASISLHQH